MESDKEWRWPGGAILRMRYLESSSDWMRYWGHAYTWIGWDELPTWPDMLSYSKMKARLRSAHPIPNKRIRATGNPGGPGHNHVKAYWRIGDYPMGNHLFTEGGMSRMFIRSRLSDNPILLNADPLYSQRLEGLGSPDLVRAWLEGDWSVVAGAYFPEFNIDQHVIKPFTIPDHWARYRAMDWGSYRPFAVGWFAVSDGDLLPRGSLVMYREWYGQMEGQINLGLKLSADEVAIGIREMEGSERFVDSVLDPSAFAVDGGPSIAERMLAHGVVWRRADNKRTGGRGALGGWDQLRARLKGEDKPMIYFFDTCTNTIRTLPALQHDQTRPEDVDSDGEDHAGDMVRYMCMARPITKDLVKPEDARFPIHRTFNEHLDAVRKRRQKDLD